jgi:hypothetical protein
MPYIYPPAQGTVSGDTYSASRFLQQPRLVQRALRTIAQQRFIADVLLSQRIQASGGGILYEVSESIYATRLPESVPAGSEYPQSGLTTGTATLASITKWGEAAQITDEQISRTNMDAVNRAMQKVVNQMVKTIDGVFLTAIGTAVTQSVAATATWPTIASANILLDLNKAKAAVWGQNQGYDPDTVVVDDTNYALLVSDRNLIAGLGREAVSTPTATGEIPTIAGLRILASPNLPSGVRALVLDSRMLGAVGYERLESPGYDGDPANGIESKVIREDNKDQWLLQCRRPVVPVVQEPSSACIITGT